jgi:hypothetical protein
VPDVEDHDIEVLGVGPWVNGRLRRNAQALAGGESVALRLCFEPAPQGMSPANKIVAFPQGALRGQNKFAQRLGGFDGDGFLLLEMYHGLSLGRGGLDALHAEKFAGITFQPLAEFREGDQVGHVPVFHTGEEQSPGTENRSSPRPT